MNYDPDDDLDLDDANDMPRPTFAETLQALREGASTGLSAAVYYGLSDLEPPQIAELQTLWENLDADYRARLLEELVDTSETNSELDYVPLAFFGIEDSDAGVRAAAVELLWADESLQGMRALLKLAFEDDSAVVRARAASGLGKYILLGEFNDLPETQTSAAVDTCLALFRDEDEDLEVRRRALESLGNSSRDGISEAIEEAYGSQEPLFKIGAVFAMGRSYDEMWAPMVLHELNSPEPELRYEAARAAGEIGIEDAIPKLSRMAHEPDRDIREVAIWALGEIGGKEATRVLQRLLDDPAYAVDEALIETLEDALVSATMPGDDLLLGENYDDSDTEYDDPRGRASRWN